MDTKTYCAPTMAQAIAEVKRDLGRDAVILHTRSFRRGGLLGFGGRPMWEVTASAHVNVPQRLPAGCYVPVASDAALAVADAGTSERSVADIGQRMGEIHHMLQRLLTRPLAAPASGVPDELAAWRRHLLRQEISEEIADELLTVVEKDLPAEDLIRGQVVREKLIELIASRLSAVAPELPPTTGRPRVIVLIGPTGVGKTTTIAKLAARFKLAECKRVGLITIDTYRIAAVDQLKTYAQIIEVPLRTVLQPPELTEAIAAMVGLDVVLIDTAGRSPADATRLQQMRAFLEVAQADEVHLVVSATAGRSWAARVVDQFGPLGANRWILSKLDEASALGVVVDVAGAVKSPLSFVTTGQEVPDDIAAANPRRLAELIVGDSPYGG